MAQWKDTRTIDGMKVVPLVDTSCFTCNLAGFTNAILDLFLLETPYSKEETKKRFGVVRKKYLARNYSTWEEGKCPV